MKKSCCDIKVTETEKGFQIELTGENLKDKTCHVIAKTCCNENTDSKFDIICK